jgi:hypothetical protein
MLHECCQNMGKITVRCKRFSICRAEMRAGKSVLVQPKEGLKYVKEVHMMMESKGECYMNLTGQDIHEAFMLVEPTQARAWDEINVLAHEKYEEMAAELNKRLEADSVTISSIRCPQCSEMLQAEHAEKHACWLLEDICSTQS